MIGQTPKFCIHLPHRTDREQYISELKLSFPDLSIVEGIYNKQHGAAGISESFKKVIQHAKNKQLESVLIFEDDVEILQPVQLFQDAINELPADWDILLGGVYYLGLIDNNIESYSENLYKCNKWNSLHCSLFNKKCFDTVLKHDALTMTNNIDVWLCNQGLKVYCCKPFFAMQHDGFSDNANMVTKFNRICKRL